jgi:hypothetical protein
LWQVRFSPACRLLRSFRRRQPTIVEPEVLLSLATLLRTAFDIALEAEVAVEIDPHTLTPEQ